MMFTSKRDSWGCVVNAYSVPPRFKRGRVRDAHLRFYWGFVYLLFTILVSLLVEI